METTVVLDFVNGVRASAGLPPVRDLEPGMRLVQRDCVLARAIGGGAVVSARHTDVFGRRYRHPRKVSRWIRRFDRGKFPHLVTLRPTRTGIWHLDFTPSASCVLACAGARERA
jgi:hypothetical protein